MKKRRIQLVIDLIPLAAHAGTQEYAMIQATAKRTGKPETNPDNSEPAVIAFRSSAEGR